MSNNNNNAVFAGHCCELQPAFFGLWPSNEIYARGEAEVLKKTVKNCVIVILQSSAIFTGWSGYVKHIFGGPTYSSLKFFLKKSFSQKVFCKAFLPKVYILCELFFGISFISADTIYQTFSEI